MCIVNYIYEATYMIPDWLNKLLICSYYLVNILIINVSTVILNHTNLNAKTKKVHFIFIMNYKNYFKCTSYCQQFDYLNPVLVF